MVTPVWIGSPNHRARPGGVRHIDLHWMVGNLRGTDSIFQRPGGTATHYGIENGVVHQYVDESRRAPGTGNNHANNYGVSIEHAGGWLLPDGSRFKPSAASHETSAQLCADIARRHGLGRLTVGQNVFPHNNWVATQCPGSLDLQWIAARANEIMGLGGSPGPQGPGAGWVAGGIGNGLNYGSAAGRPAWRGIQEYLADIHGYAAGIDGIPGVGTWKALQKDLAAYWGYDGEIDGLPGEKSWKAFQRMLATHFGYGGDIDGIPGPKTYAAMAAAGSHFGGVYGAAVSAPPFPLPDGHWFGPRHPESELRSVSGYYGHREDLRRFMAQMQARGWDFSQHGADGLYGGELRANTIAFQREKGLVVDGLIGEETWTAAWTAPIT